MHFVCVCFHSFGGLDFDLNNQIFTRYRGGYSRPVGSPCGFHGVSVASIPYRRVWIVSICGKQGLQFKSVCQFHSFGGLGLGFAGGLNPGDVCDKQAECLTLRPMPVENWSCHPAAVICHAMDANPAIGSRQVEIADIPTEFPIIAASVRGQRIARELIEAFNLGFDLIDCDLLHRCSFLFFKVGLPCTAGRVGVKICTPIGNASGFLNYF